MKPLSFNLSGLALVAGGALWLLGSIGSPALAPAALLLLIGLAGLTAARGETPGVAGLAGLALVAVGCIAVAGAGLAGSERGDSTLAPGLVVLSAGLVLLGSRLMSTRRRAWQPLPLLLGLLGLLLPMGAGVDGAPGLAVWLVWGIGWLWLGAIAIVEHAATAPERA